MKKIMFGLAATLLLFAAGCGQVGTGERGVDCRSIVVCSYHIERD